MFVIDFMKKNKDFLNQFDCFIVGPFMGLILAFEKLNKPIIVLNATRYEYPFDSRLDLWDKLNEVLVRKHKEGKLFIVSNNKADQRYLRFCTGLDSTLIPSLCSYTKSVYSGINEKFVCHRNNPILMSHLPKSPLIETKFFSYPHSYQNYFDFKGIIHIPYQISTMSIFEQYTANVPLFFPRKSFYYLCTRHILTLFYKIYPT